MLKEPKNDLEKKESRSRGPKLSQLNDLQLDAVETTKQQQKKKNKKKNASKCDHNSFFLYLGCHRQPGLEMVIKTVSVIHNAPGACFQSCGASTQIIALQVQYSHVELFFFFFFFVLLLFFYYFFFARDVPQALYCFTF